MDRWTDLSLMCSVEGRLVHGEGLLEPGPLRAARRGSPETAPVVKARIAVAVLTAIGPHLPDGLPARWALLDVAALDDVLAALDAHRSSPGVVRRSAETVRRCAEPIVRLRDVAVAGRLPVPGWVTDALGRPSRGTPH